MKIQITLRLSPAGQPSGQTNAFTLVELMVVILTTAILAALLLPAMANSGIKDQEIQCLGNLKQLQIAWLSYAADNGGRIPQNLSNDSPGFTDNPLQAGAQPGQPNSSWVLGDVSQNAGATNTLLLTHGLIYPYVGNSNAYACPSNTKKTSNGTRCNRTYSMNAWMDGIPPWIVTLPQVDFTTLAGINSKMLPAMALVFIEESPVTINDGYWVQDLDNRLLWIDSPAHYHLNAGCMSFADGHCQTRKWTDKYVLANDDGGASGFPCDPKSGDLAWVQLRCTVLSR
jgi:type II secretory pathway pseudopilin PulG